MILQDNFQKRLIATCYFRFQVNVVHRHLLAKLIGSRFGSWGLGLRSSSCDSTGRLWACAPLFGLQAAARQVALSYNPTGRDTPKQFDRTSAAQSLPAWGGAEGGRGSTVRMTILIAKKS